MKQSPPDSVLQESYQLQFAGNFGHCCAPSCHNIFRYDLLKSIPIALTEGRVIWKRCHNTELFSRGGGPRSLVSGVERHWGIVFAPKRFRLPSP